MSISSQNPTFDHILELSQRDDSNKWLNIGFGKEITQVESIEVNYTYLFWSSINVGVYLFAIYHRQNLLKYTKTMFLFSIKYKLTSVLSNVLPCPSTNASETVHETTASAKT